MLDQGQMRDWFSSPVIQVTALVSVVSGVTFVVQGLGFGANIIDFSLMRDRRFAGANAAMMGFGLAMFGSIAILPLFVQWLLGYPMMEAGYLFVPRGIAAGVSMVFTGSVLLGRVDPRALVAGGLIVTGAGNIAYGWLDLTAEFWHLAIPGVVSGLGMGLFFVPMSTLGVQNIGPEQQDEASGIYGVARSIGSSLGIAVVGWQVASPTQFHWSVLSERISPFNPDVLAYLRPLGQLPNTPEAAQTLAGLITQQARMLAFQDAFWLTG